MTPESDRDDQRDGLGTPPALQFRLTTLFASLAICSVLFAVMVVIGKTWSMLLLFVAILIGAHVAGAVIGTHLRDQARRHAPATDVPYQMTARNKPSNG